MSEIKPSFLASFVKSSAPAQPLTREAFDKFLNDDRLFKWREPVRFVGRRYVRYLTEVAVDFGLVPAGADIMPRLSEIESAVLTEQWEWRRFEAYLARMGWRR